MQQDNITEALRKVLEYLEKGQVLKGIELLNSVGGFDGKTEEQVQLLEYIAIMLED